MLFKKLNPLIIKSLLLILPVLSSCAFGGKVNYQGVSTFSAPAIESKIALVVQDHRPYVLSKDKNLNWVGLRRALNGIPYGVHTQSGKPMADDLGSIIVNTINKQDSSRSYQIVATPFDNFDSLGCEKA